MKTENNIAKVGRLIAFIPGTFVTMVIVNILYSILVYIFSIIHLEEITPFSFIWDYFLRAGVITVSSFYVGLYIFPFKNKLPALITVTFFYFSLFILVFLFYQKNWDLINNYIEPNKLVFAKINQIAIIVGTIIGIGISWKGFYNSDEF
jgi:ABC-type multidrug transport system permease subunit